MNMEILYCDVVVALPGSDSPVASFEPGDYPDEDAMKSAAIATAQRLSAADRWAYAARVITAQGLWRTP